MGNRLHGGHGGGYPADRAIDGDVNLLQSARPRADWNGCSSFYRRILHNLDELLR